MVDSQRQRDGDGDDPDGQDHQHTHVDLHARLERVDDDEVAVDGDGGGGERGHVDADAEGHGHDVAQRLAEDPRVEEEGHGREGNSQETHADIRHGQVGDEDVGDGLHGLVAHHHEGHQHVADEAQEEDERVEDDEERHEPRQPHHLFRLTLCLSGAARAHAAGSDGLKAHHVFARAVCRPRHPDGRSLLGRAGGDQLKQKQGVVNSSLVSFGVSVSCQPCRSPGDKSNSQNCFCTPDQNTSHLLKPEVITVY